MKQIHSILIFCLLFFVIETQMAQRVMQIETRGKVNTIKFYEGDEIYIKLDNEDFWRSAMILEVNVEEKTVDFDFGTAEVSEIKSLQTITQRNKGKNVRRALLYASAGYLIYSPLEIAFQDDPNWPLIIGGAGLAPLGLLLNPIINGISRHNFGKRKRLRLLDLTFYADPPRS